MKTVECDRQHQTIVPFDRCSPPHATALRLARPARVVTSRAIASPTRSVSVRSCAAALHGFGPLCTPLSATMRHQSSYRRQHGRSSNQICNGGLPARSPPFGQLHRRRRGYPEEHRRPTFGRGAHRSTGPARRAARRQYSSPAASPIPDQRASTPVYWMSPLFESDTSATDGGPPELKVT